MHDRMYDMAGRSVSVRELQQSLKQVLQRVERGEVVEVTRRRRPVARLSPVAGSEPPAAWPDLEQRARAVFGRRVVRPGPAALLLAARGKG